MKAPCAHGNSLHVTARLMLSSMTSKTLRCKYSDFDVFPGGIVNHRLAVCVAWDGTARPKPHTNLTLRNYKIYSKEGKIKSVQCL